MYWRPNKLRLPLIALAAFAALSATAAAANILVVRSSGPSARAYPPGKALAPNARVTLRQGDTIVLLDGRGTRTLRGPGSYAAGAAAQVTTRSALTVNNNGRIGRIGASRDPGALPRSPSIWHVDVSQSATVCVADPRGLVLWRPSATRTVDLRIAPASGDASAARTVRWTAGQPTLAWPSDVRILNDAEYRLSIEGVAVPTRLRFRVLPAAPSGLDAQAQAFIQNGCERQLDVLIDTVQVPA
ncbi:MAG TPA: hypothetical protein VGB08_07505 [Allosphingosinicella sp.]